MSLATKNTKSAKHSWPMVRLGDVCIVQRGVRVTRKDLVEDGKYFVYQNSLKPLGRYDAFNCDGNNPFMIMALAAGEVGFSESPFWAADDCTYFKDLKGIDSRYLFYNLVNSNFELRRYIRQATIPRLSNKFLEELKIPLPPLPIQHEIVARLEKELGEADRLAEKFKKIAELADAEFKAELDETFKNVKGEKVRLGDVCEIQRGGSPRPIKKFLTDAEDGLNWIKIGDVSADGKYITSVADKIKPSGLNKTRWVKSGDFLLSNSMSFGRPYILKLDGCIHDGWLVLHGFQSHFLEDYFYYLLRSSSVQSQFDALAHGSSVRNLNTGAVSIVEVHVATRTEQESVILKLENAMMRCEKLKAAAEKGLREAEKLRKAILAEAFACDEAAEGAA